MRFFFVNASCAEAALVCCVKSLDHFQVARSLLLAPTSVVPFPSTRRSTYVKRLKEIVCTSSKKSFRAVEQLEGDGLYIGKRPIIGAQGQGQLLNEAGSVFYHTCLYLKAGDKVLFECTPLDL